MSRIRLRLPDRRTCVVLALLVAIALLLDFLYYTGFYASDDISYLRTAREIGTFGDAFADYNWRGSIANTRLGITVPDGLVYWVSGGDVSVIAAGHVVYHLMLVVLAFAIGREVWDVRTGLLAAALVATSPILYLFAGAVLPDHAMSVWLALLLLVLLRARRRDQKAPLAVREAARRYVPAGLLLGLAYGCKETAIIMAVPCAAVIIAAAPSLRSWRWVRDGAFLAAGLVAFLVLEQLVLRAITGDWISRFGGVADTGAAFEARMAKHGVDPLERFTYLGGLLRKLLPLSSALLLITAIVFPFLRRRDAALIAFFWWPLVYLTIGPTSLGAYRPPSIQERYYAIVVLPGAVMAAVVLGRAVERWSARGWSMRAVVALVSVVTFYEARADLSFGGTAYRSEFVRGFTMAYETARARYPDHPILLSKGYLIRMHPALFPDDPGPRPKDPPFLRISQLDDALPEGPAKIREIKKRKHLHVRTVAILYPPRRRIDILLDRARALFGLDRPPVSNSRAGAAVIQLVTKITGDEPPLYQRLPLFTLGSVAAVTSVDGGSFVAWTEGRRVVLQHHDARNPRRVPEHPAAQLGTASPRVRVELDLELSRARPTKIRVLAFGYDAAGVRVDAEQELVVDAASPASIASVEVASATPIVAVRVRLWVYPGSDDGQLYVGNPRITPLP